MRKRIFLNSALRNELRADHRTVWCEFHIGTGAYRYTDNHIRHNGLRQFGQDNEGINKRQPEVPGRFKTYRNNLQLEGCQTLMTEEGIENGFKPRRMTYFLGLWVVKAD